MTLRPSLNASIQRALGSPSGTFVSTDFRLVATSETKGTKLAIEHEYSKSYFVAQLPSRQTLKPGGVASYDITFSCRPGQLNIVETSSATDDTTLVEAIEQWRQRIEDDFAHSDQAKAVHELEEKLTDLYAKIGLTDETDGPLESEDVASIVDWIRKLEADMAANVAKAEKDHAAAERKIKNLKIQVDALVVIVGSQITKRGAIRALIGRVTKWGAQPENQQLLKDAGKVVVGLLTDGAKHGQ